jgi:hypothetical protein
MEDVEGTPDPEEPTLPPGVRLRVLPSGDLIYRVEAAGVKITCRYSPAAIKEQIGKLIDAKFEAARSGGKTEPDVFLPGAGLSLVIEAKHEHIAQIEEGRHTAEEVEREKARYAEESYRHFSENFPRELLELPGVFLLKVTTATVAYMSREGMLRLTGNSRAGLIDDVFEELKRKFKKDWVATRRGNPTFVLEWPEERIIEFGKTYNRLLAALQGAQEIYRNRDAYKPEEWSDVARRRFPDLPPEAIMQLPSGVSIDQPYHIARQLVAEQFGSQSFNDYHERILARANELIKQEG